ncbi:hypothetical protein [Candidatus Poriferisodalis sp.]|uniref:hypothetical protein n=1 Tax=Candidatus Poriferisodalis sp. TaxID=3101277 RepID=UPI003B029FFE
MAVRIQNSAAIDHGDAAADVTITHAMVEYGPPATRATLVDWTALTASVAVKAGRPMQFDANEFDLVIKSGGLDDAGLKNLIDSALGVAGSNFLVRLGTALNTEVTDANYSAQVVAGSALTTSTEAD